MREQYVPVSLGTDGARSLEVGGILVSDLRFPARLRIAPHEHERACLAVTLGGSLDTAMASRTFPCHSASVLTEPAGERHANFIDGAGATVLVLQPAADRIEELRPCGAALHSISHRRDLHAAELARRAARELASPDSATPLALEGLVLELLARASRLADPARERPAPHWLGQVREILHAHFRERLGLGEVARIAGLHPVYLARAFRANLGVSVGGYVRRLRIEWAAAELARPERRLADVALEAGFSDQSHFSRVFHACTGDTPKRFRMRIGRG